MPSVRREPKSFNGGFMHLENDWSSGLADINERDVTRVIADGGLRAPHVDGERGSSFQRGDFKVRGGNEAALPDFHRAISTRGKDSLWIKGQSMNEIMMSRSRTCDLINQFCFKMTRAEVIDVESIAL